MDNNGAGTSGTLPAAAVGTGQVTGVAGPAPVNTSGGMPALAATYQETQQHLNGYHQHAQNVLNGFHQQAQHTVASGGPGASNHLQNLHHQAQSALNSGHQEATRRLHVTHSRAKGAGSGQQLHAGLNAVHHQAQQHLNNLHHHASTHLNNLHHQAQQAASGRQSS